MNLKRQSFYKHKADQEITHSVTRSSAVFYFSIKEPVRTSIYFLNYWTLKRDIHDVQLHLTIRNMDGTSVVNQVLETLNPGAIEIDVLTVLTEHGIAEKLLEGSIELEFISSNNLFIPFPAVVIRYYTEMWHTVAHSSQRYFSESSGDTDVEAIKIAQEGNQTIHSNENYEPCFIIHNGPQLLVDDDFNIEIISESGRKKDFPLKNLKWKPYQTRFFELNRIADIRSFLNGEAGTYRLNYSLSGVFPRIIAGFRDTESGAWSLDHTNFASTSGQVLNDVFPVKKEIYFKNLVFNVPTPKQQGIRSYIDVYPTYPEDDYCIEVREKPSNKMAMVKVNLPKASKGKLTRIETSGHNNAEINFLAESSLPRRFHLGIHYQMKDNPPAFLIDGPLPYSSGGQKTRWFPVFAEENIQNLLAISYRELGAQIAPESITCLCTL